MLLRSCTGYVHLRKHAVKPGKRRPWCAAVRPRRSHAPVGRGPAAAPRRHPTARARLAQVQRGRVQAGPVRHARPGCHPAVCLHPVPVLAHGARATPVRQRPLAPRTPQAQCGSCADPASQPAVGAEARRRARAQSEPPTAAAAAGGQPGRPGQAAPRGRGRVPGARRQVGHGGAGGAQAADAEAHAAQRVRARRGRRARRARPAAAAAAPAAAARARRGAGGCSARAAAPSALAGNTARWAARVAAAGRARLWRRARAPGQPCLQASARRAGRPGRRGRRACAASHASTVETLCLKTLCLTTPPLTQGAAQHGAGAGRSTASLPPGVGVGPSHA